MKIFKTRYFSKWAKKRDLKDALLLQIAQDISNGIFEANLGGGVLKKRIATEGRGKRASVRSIIIYKRENHCFFVYGFLKNEKTNITPNEEAAFKILARELLNLSEPEIVTRLRSGALLEIGHEEKQNN